MKDYANMSDFEITQMVSAYLWGSVCAVDGVVLHGEMDGAFDPCNNPADAWPIITGSMISIRPVGNDGKLWEASGIDGMKADYDKNPLRSAMIVFLVMKESEND